MKIFIRIVVIFSVSLLILIAFNIDTKAEQDNDITKHCNFYVSSNLKDAGRIIDGKRNTVWRAQSGVQSLTIRVPYVYKELQGFYFVWTDNLVSWSLYAVKTNNPIKIKDNSDGGFFAEYVQIPEQYRDYNCFELVAEPDTLMNLAEVYVYNESVPYYVPQWEVYDGENVHMMVICCHPDDENLYMGPFIPVTANAGKKSVTVFMTAVNSIRRIEAQESVWSMGETICPVLRMKKDTYTGYKSTQIYGWTRDESLEFVVEQIRKYKPVIIATHDIKGEYGHGSHVQTSSIVREAVTISGDASKFPDSVNKYGIWSANELYVHLYGSNTVYFDVDMPLPAFDGATVYDIVKRAYIRHDTQLPGRKLPVHGMKYDMAKFGLYWINPDICALPDLIK